MAGAMPNAVDNVIAQAVGDSSDWIDIPLQQQSAEATERETDKTSRMYIFSLTANLRRLSAAKHSTLYGLSAKRFLLDYTDNHGVRRLIGTPDEPVAMRMPRSESRRMAKDAPEYQLVFNCTTRAPHPFYAPA